jgi:hypothetical protein
VTELDLLRREFEAVPESDEETVLRARARLLEEIASQRPRLRPRRPLRFLAAVAAVALVAGVVALVVPREHALTGEAIAAATYRVFTTPRGVIRHVVVTQPSGSRVEEWVAGSPPYATHTRTAAGETEITRCGQITYDSVANLVTVHEEPRNPVWFFRHGRDDPAREFLLGAGEYVSPARFGPLRYLGKTTFRGIPAYRLVRLDRTGHGWRVVYLVRRDSYYPLRIALYVPGQPPSVDTFSAFELIPRGAGTEHLLHLGPHPGAFLLRTSVTNFYRPRDCAGFAAFQSLTGQEGRP